MRRSTRYYVCLALLLCLPSWGQLAAEGFLAGTLVKTPHGYTPIEQLQAGDAVLAYNAEGVLVKQSVSHRVEKRHSRYIELVIGDAVLSVAPDHKFYLPHESAWIEAQHLAPHHALLKDCAECSLIIDVRHVDKHALLYDITVEQHHNFCISSWDLHVHNFLPAIGLTFSFLFGGGAIEFAGVGISAAIGGLALGAFFSKKEKKVKTFLKGQYDSDHSKPTPNKHGGSGSSPNDQKNNKKNNNKQPSAEQLDHLERVKNLEKSREIEAIYQELESAASDYYSRIVGQGGVSVSAYKKMIEETEQGYELIRKLICDIKEIYANTKLPVDAIEQVKHHLFHATHFLQGEMQRFQADEEILAAWNRLRTGTFVKADLVLFCHEFVESTLMTKFGLNYETAHNLANQAHNWQIIIKEAK